MTYWMMLASFMFVGSASYLAGSAKELRRVGKWAPSPWLFLIPANVVTVVDVVLYHS